MTSSTRRDPGYFGPALACALAGAAMFQFFGNATRGYIDTASLFYWWGFQWFNAPSEMEHGPIILVIGAWLLVRNLRARSEGRAANGESLWPALVAMVAGLALHAVGFAGQQGRISIVALLIFAWGVLRLGGGRRWGAAAVFPLGFLVFAIPLNVLDSVGFWLRLWVIKASAGITHAAGIGVLQNGTQLLAPDGRYNYDVAAACSGVRSLMALAALSLLVGYLNFRAWWRRGVLLLLCFPLVYLGNVARVAAIVFAAQWAGSTWGERVHEWFGFVVFVIVLGGVLAAARAMERFLPEDGGVGAVAPNRPDAVDGRANEIGRLRATAPTLIAAAVVVLAAGEMFFLQHLSSLPPRGRTGVTVAADGRNPVELPAFLGTEWVGRRAAVTEVEREILPPDTGFARKLYVAVADPRRQVFVSIVLSGRDRTSIHRPEICLVGQGWTITDATEHRFDLSGRSAAMFSATVLRVRREVATPRGRVMVPQLVVYWFVGGDAVVATHWQRLALDAWNRVMHARTDRWAYVLVQTDASDGEAAALSRMQAVLNETLPVFQRPLPRR